MSHSDFLNDELETIDKKLKLMTFDDYHIIESYLIRYPDENCDFNICVLFSWGLFFKMEFAVHFDRLILFNPYYQYLLAPKGEKLTAQELYQLNNCCKKIHKNTEIMVVSEEYVRNTPNIYEFFSVENDLAWNDYVYLTENLVNLSGKKLAKKKNLISQFKRLYPIYDVKPITSQDYREIVDFSLYWQGMRGSQSEILLNNESNAGKDFAMSDTESIEFEAIKLTMKHWDLLPSEGLKIYAGGKLCAYSIFSPQTQDMATVHFEKYDPEIKGAGQIINQETAKVLLPRFKFINREQDMGDEGIRQAKRSYQPLKQIPYYRLKSK
jgi:hypothetical protein